MASPSIFSFFAGTGFLDLGFELNGFNMAYVNELHTPFMDSYQYSRLNLGIPHPMFGCVNEDVGKLVTSSGHSELTSIVQESRSKSDFVGFIGGPPCPDFSVAGKNRGHTGEHGKLTATYVKLICQQQPSFFLFENVKGLWRTKKHRAFYEEMKAELHLHGYLTTERLVNALEFGVPQNRERIILLGFRRDILRDLGIVQEGIDVLPEGVFPWDRYIKYPLETLRQLPWPTTSLFREDGDVESPEGIPLELTVEYWFRKNSVLDHPNAGQYFRPRQGLLRFQTVEEGDDSRKSFKRLHRWRYSPTVAYGNNEVHLHPYKIRRISVAEALALQSMPKEFTIPINITLTNAFKTVGNGVPYLVSQSLAQSILDFLGVHVEQRLNPLGISR